ncbi:hypothetical protein HK105_201433 [Polyrhizophydium stewartii]|uniref:Uncharacterized protein n=1 Tax=Polyrhizophydium stewartii TaxID=2732419 RepID=A0ABR4NI08_9FUNG
MLTLIEIFANKVLTLSLIESLPKEKTALLGTSEITLYKAFLGYATREPDSDASAAMSPLTFRETVPIVYTNPKLLSPSPESQKTTPECVIEVLLSRPLLMPEEITGGNFVNLRIDEVYPVPEEWTTKEGNEKDLNSNIFSYAVNLVLPSANGGERMVSIGNGSLVPYDAPVNLDPSLNVPQTVCISDTRKEPQTSQSSTPIAGVAVAQVNEEPEHEASETRESKRVVFGTSVVVYLAPVVLQRIRKLAQERRPLELEVLFLAFDELMDRSCGCAEPPINLCQFVRTLQPKFASVTDTNASKYRGKASIDVTMMMYPNVIGIKGRFPLDVYEASDAAAQADPNNLYRAIGSAISMEFLLTAPLIDKKRLQAITKSVSDFIPKRHVPPNMLFEKRSQQAEQDFRIKINEIVHKLVAEYRTTLRMEASARGDVSVNLNLSSQQEEQQRKKLFMYHLNKSGAYFSFKEQLKASVVQVVRERFMRKSPFASQSELQLFMSQVYVYLVDQMHVAINKVFSEREAEFVDPTINRSADFKALKEFADASELNCQPSIAAKYHLERVAKYEEFDYGCFSMRNGMPDKGEECFKEILSRNPKHVPTLLVYGAVCCAHERFEEAHVYLASAVQLEPRYVLANAFLQMRHIILMHVNRLLRQGIFFEILGQDSDAEKCLAEAQALHEASGPPKDAPTHFLLAAEFAIQAHLGEFADRALAHELLHRGPSVRPYVLLSQLETQRGCFSKAADYLKQALAMESGNLSVWASLGHLHFVQNRFNDAKQSYETVLSMRRGADERELVLIYIRLGTIYLRNAYLATSGTHLPPSTPISHLQFLRSRDEAVDTSLALIAKSMFLKASAIAPSSQSWLGAGKTCFALREYQEAEDAFAEANVLNNRDSEVWAYLALLSLTLGRTVEAHQAIAQALRLGIKDSEILRAVGVAFMNENQIMAAVECLRIALEEDPENATTRELFTQALGKGGRSFLSSQGAEAVVGGLDGVQSDVVLGESGALNPPALGVPFKSSQHLLHQQQQQQQQEQQQQQQQQEPQQQQPSQQEQQQEQPILQQPGGQMLQPSATGAPLSPQQSLAMDGTDGLLAEPVLDGASADAIRRGSTVG